MKIRGFVVGFIVGLGLLALPSLASAGWFGQGDRTIELRHGSGSVEIQLVPDRGKALVLKPRGPHRWVFDGVTEALVGGSYSIELRNRSSQRIKIVVGVDGLNVYGKDRIVGRADGDTGSILAPGETRILKGWQMDQSTAQRFVFSPPEWSEGQGRTDSQIGLIVVQVYRERQRELFGLKDRAKCGAPPSGEALEREEAPRAQIGTTSGDDVTSHVRTVHFESLTSYPEVWAEVDYGRFSAPPPRPRSSILGVTVFTCDLGSRIDGVVPGSIADEAGLKLGDIIVRVDTEDRPSAQKLSEILRSKRPGDLIFLQVQRGRHEISLKIRL